METLLQHIKVSKKRLRKQTQTARIYQMYVWDIEKHITEVGGLMEFSNKQKEYWTNKPARWNIKSGAT